MNGNTNTNSNVAAVAITDVLNDKVVIVIADMTGRNEIFTAFDVTKQIRSTNPTMNVPHDEVKEMVREMYRSQFCDDYDCRCIELTVSAMAYVYYPEDESPYDHPLAAKPNTDKNAGTDDAGNTDLTVEKRLNIGKHLLDKLGLLPGKLVKVVVDNGVMSLTPTTDASGSTLVVNADGRLRIGSKMLTAAFGRLPAKFEIAVSSDTSVIKVSANTDNTDTDGFDSDW